MLAVLTFVKRADTLPFVVPESSMLVVNEFESHPQLSVTNL